MRRHRLSRLGTLVLTASVLVLGSCNRSVEPPGPPEPPSEERNITGIVTPPGPGLTIAAVREDSVIASGPVDAESGRYALTFTGAPPSEIRVSGVQTPFPFVLTDIPIVPGIPLNIDLPPDFYGPVEHSPSPESEPERTLTLAGWISAPTARLALSRNGTDAAVVTASPADSGGRYELAGVATGPYTLTATADGYATERLPVTVAAPATTTRTEVAPTYLFYKTARDGVDWERHVLRATGHGKPSSDRQGPQARLMARRAAQVDAYRNLLAAVANLNIQPGRPLGDESYRDTERFTRRLQGIVQGARVIDERTNDDGSVDVTLEIPLTGARGINGSVWTSPAPTPPHE